MSILSGFDEQRADLFGQGTNIDPDQAGKLDDVAPHAEGDESHHDAFPSLYGR